MRIIILAAVLLGIAQIASCGSDFVGSFKSSTHKMDAHFERLNKY